VAPLDRLNTTSFQSADLGIALSCTIFEIFDVEEYRRVTDRQTDGLAVYAYVVL